MLKELLRESLLYEVLNAGEGEGDAVDVGESYPPPPPDPEPPPITFLSKLGLSSLCLSPVLLSTPSREEHREFVLDGFCLKYLIINDRNFKYVR